MPRTLAIAGLAGALIILACGCTTYRETQPTHTATEELLTSHASELAAEKLAAALPATRDAIFIDTSRFKNENSDYAVSAIDAALLRRGLILAPDKKTSRLTLELRAGAISIDQRDMVFGLPAGYLPIPGTLSAFPIPEISVYSSNNRTGVAEFSAVLYDSATGAPVAFAGPVAGQRKLATHRYLFIFGGGSRVETPHDGNGPVGR